MSCGMGLDQLAAVMVLGIAVRLKMAFGASLVAQWLRVRLPMRGTRVRAPVREDPTCRRDAGPVSHGR